MRETIGITIPGGFDHDPPYQEIGTILLKSYFSIEIELPVVPTITEASDEEFLQFMEAAGAFAFLESREEDLYSLEDGTPL